MTAGEDNEQTDSSEEVATETNKDQEAPTSKSVSKKKKSTLIKIVPAKKLQKIENLCPRGQPKSGRPWKEPKQKFSIVKKSIYRRPFHKKIELKQEMKHIKELSNSIKEAKKEEKVVKKQRRLENAERKLQNQRKSEIVQVIKDPKKLKRMKKKHLRMIEKRDFDKIKRV